ncbi:MAG: L,D-transpeptidase family protein [Patescibacteria group bacterium]
MKALFCSLIFLLFFSWPAFAGEVPENFRTYEVKKGDTLWNLAPQEHWELIEKVNKVDRYHLIPGRIILLPENEKAHLYSQLPEFVDNFQSVDKLFYVNLKKQCFGVYFFGKLQFWGPISSGKKGHETPTGWFKVLNKEVYRESIKYDYVPMPYSLRFYKGYFIHQQALPGKPASLGCVRLLEEDAKKVFSLFSKGDYIFIE